MKLTQIPPVALALLLQLVPLCRSFQSALALPSTPLSAIFRWFVASAAALGTVDAVSGASAPVVILSPTTSTATNGSPYLYLITQSSTYTDIGHHFEAVPLPAGLSVRTVEGNGLPAFGIISGIPTESGNFTVLLTARFENDHHPNEPYPVTNLFLTILGSPTIQAPPVDTAVEAGKPVQMTVSANVAPAPTYQWRRNGVALPNQTLSNLVINAAAPEDSGEYEVVISNSYGSITSSPPARLTVKAAPPSITITNQPTSSTVFEGENLQLSVGVSSPDSHSLTFAWLKDGQSVEGTGSELNLSPAQPSHAGVYQVRIRQEGSAETVLSSEARITVLPAPHISMAHLMEGQLHLNFHAEPGARYQVEYATEITPTDWTPLGAEIIPSQSSEQTVIDASPAPIRYYRLKAWVNE